MLQHLLLIVIVLCGARGAFARSYDPQYDALREAVVKARLPLDLQQKILAGAVKVRRTMARPSRDFGVQGRHQLLDADRALDRANIPSEVKTEIRMAIDKLSTPMRPVPTDLDVQVIVRTFTAPSVAAGAGVVIRVDGEDTALTGADGTATLKVSTGDHQITAVQSLDTGGTIQATISANQSSPVDIVMQPGGDYALVRDIVTAEAVDGVVPRDFSSFTLRFVDDAGNPIALNAILSAQLLHSGKTTNILSNFALRTAGEAAAVDIETFRASLIDKYGPFDIRLRGTDALGRTYSNTVRFDLGRYRASGSVAAPADVPLGGISVRITNQRSGFSFWATTSSSGAVSFPALLPEGMYIIAAETISGGIRYHDYDAFRLEADNSFALTLHSFVDATTASGMANHH
jgi:hypothetical protein